MTTINSQEEFLQALRENPAWREAVRAELLGEEIPQLPTRFQALLERMDGFIAEQKEINRRLEGFVAELKAVNQRLDGFIAEQKAINQRLEGFVAEQIRINDNAQARFSRIDSDTARIRGYYAQARVRESAEVIAMEMGLYFVKVLTEADLMRIYQKANGNLSRGQRRSFQGADLVVETLDGDATVYIAGEISYTADHRDSDRVLRNARLLKEYTGNDAIPTVISVRNDFHVESLVEAGELTWYEIDGRKIGMD